MGKQLDVMGLKIEKINVGQNKNGRNGSGVSIDANKDIGRKPPIDGKPTLEVLEETKKSDVKYWSLEEVMMLQVNNKDVVDGLFSENTLTMIAGEPGSLKTFTVLSLGLSLAGGYNWIGRKVNPMKVLFIEQEMGPEYLKERFHMIFEGMDEDIILEKFDNFRMVSHEDLYLRDEANIQRMKNIIDNFDPDVVILDSLASFISGMNENDAGDMQPIFDVFHNICRKDRRTMFIIHHLNKSGGYRGSSIMKGAVDNLITTDYCSKTKTLNLDYEKNRFGPQHKISLRVDIDDTTFKLDEFANGFKGGSKKPSQTEVMRYIQDRGGVITAKDFPEGAEELDMNVAAFQKIVSRLHTRGSLEKPERGVYSIPEE